MSASALADPKSEKQKPEYAPQSKLAAVYFRDSVMFGSEMQSAAVSNTGSNSVDSILPASMLADGSIRLAEGASDGLMLRKKRHDLHTNKKKLDQTFVPWSNVKSVSYGE